MDIQRYERSPWIANRGLWALAVHRLGEWIMQQGALVRTVLRPAHALLHLAVVPLSGVEIGKQAEIGGGLLIPHGAGIVINSGARIGADCVILQGVTLGNRVPHGSAPVLGDQVELGAYAQVLGGVRLANAVSVGALSLVLEDAPEGAFIAGIPARVIRRRDKSLEMQPSDAE